MGGKGSGNKVAARGKPPRQRFRLATPEEARAFEQLASDLGFADSQALLSRIVERYDEQPGLVRNALREALHGADERKIYAACVDEMLQDRGVPRPEDLIL